MKVGMEAGYVLDIPMENVDTELYPMWQVILMEVSLYGKET